MSNDNKLTFAKGNAKLDGSIITFSLPAGYTCPGAKECLARADVERGVIVDGPDAKFRCFAASQEAVYSNVRRARWRNFELLTAARLAGGKEGMVQLIMDSLPKAFEKVRVHVSGDFFNQEYFDAWLEVARHWPDKIFYAYTKSLKYWATAKSAVPDNFRLTASRGGKFDDMIEEENFREVEVIFHPDQAEGRPIDHDDSHAYTDKQENFVLLLHGVQKKDTEAAAALRVLKKEDIKHSYSTNRNGSKEKGSGVPSKAAV